jgi:hypothetical protein
MKEIQVFIGIVAIIIERYRLLREKWIRRILGKVKEAKGER